MAEAPVETAPAPRKARSLGTLAIRLGAIGAFALIIIYFAVAAPGFLSVFNIGNVVQQSAILGILSFGMAVVIIGGGSDVQTGGIDLSLAANAGLCAAVYASASNAGYSLPIAMLLTLVTGAVVGALNPLAVVKLHILPLLATLAVMNVAAGAELILTQNTVVSMASDFSMFVAMGTFLGVSILAWVFAVFSVIMIVFLHFSGIGLRLYAVGGHPEAARASGIPVDLYLAGTYIFAGTTAAVACILIVSRLSASTPGTGEMLLSVLAAALLGTVFSRRFVPTAIGTILSTLFIGFLANGFQLLNVSSYWVSGVQGALILVVVAATSFAKPTERA